MPLEAEVEERGRLDDELTGGHPHVRRGKGLSTWGEAAGHGERDEHRGGGGETIQERHGLDGPGGWIAVAHFQVISIPKPCRNTWRAGRFFGFGCGLRM